MAKKIDRKFKRKLERILKDVSSLDCHINGGGCGLFARQLSKVLISLGFDVKFVLVCNDKNGLENCEKHINNSNTNGLEDGGWRHIMIRVNGYYIDSSGVFSSFKNAQGTYLTEVNLPEKIFNEMLNPKFGITWNSVFDKNYMGIIGKKLNQLKPQYDNYGIICQ